MKIYKTKELEQFKSLIEQAKTMWIDLAQKEFQSKGDSGCCVIGAGLEVYVLPPRCKHPQSLQLISFNEVSPCQGESAVQNTSKQIVEFLKQHGLETRYNYGRMD